MFSLDFQQLGTEDFADVQKFVYAFARLLKEVLEINGWSEIEVLWESLTGFLDRSRSSSSSLKDLFVSLSSMCRNSEKPIVLMIDEVDSASNNQVFVDFLAQLRSYYLNRDKTPIFHSVILAGVYSIKDRKLKLRSEAEHQYNSPWNIAAKFKVDMSFSVDQIAHMLEEYEEGFENPAEAWSKAGVEKAVSIILKENLVLFESMAKQLDTYAELHEIIENIIYRGKRIPFSLEERSINLGDMFGYLKEENGHVAIANRIFEMVLLNMFMAKEAITSEVYERGGSDRIGFVKNSRLDVELVLKKFVEYFHEIYGEKDIRFIEKDGRKFFLLYLKAIINGTGNYYLEAQTRDERRTDVIVDYLGEQFIVELKIWHGNEYNERGEQRLVDYLDYYHKDRGYMLSFNFNKKKEIGVREIQVGGKTIVEAVV